MSQEEKNSNSNQTETYYNYNIVYDYHNNHRHNSMVYTQLRYHHAWMGSMARAYTEMTTKIKEEQQQKIMCINDEPTTTEYNARIQSV